MLTNWLVVQLMRKSQFYNDFYRQTIDMIRFEIFFRGNLLGKSIRLDRLLVRCHNDLYSLLLIDDLWREEHRMEIKRIAISVFLWSHWLIHRKSFFFEFSLRLVVEFPLEHNIMRFMQRTWWSFLSNWKPMSLIRWCTELSTKENCQISFFFLSSLASNVGISIDIFLFCTSIESEQSTRE